MKKLSYSKARSWSLTYTGGPISITNLSQTPNLILPCNGGLNKLSLETLEPTPIVENNEENPEDFDYITTFALSPRDDQTSSSFLACCSRSGLIKLFKYDDEQKNYVMEKQWRALHRTPVKSIVFDETSTLLATGATDGSVRVWDLKGNFCTG